MKRNKPSNSTNKRAIFQLSELAILTFISLMLAKLYVSATGNGNDHNNFSDTSAISSASELGNFFSDHL